MLTFSGHLEELRRRLGWCLLALIITSGLSVSQLDRLIEWLQRPAHPWMLEFAFFSPTEPLLAYMKVVILAGVILAMPVWLWQLWQFVRAGLTPSERAVGLACIGWGSAQFLAGVVFAYLVLLPISLRVLLGIGRDRLRPVISIDRYLSFVTTLAWWCGVAFELPVVLFLLAKVGVVTPEWLRQQRPHAILVLFILAAIATPTTDVVSLLLMAAPLMLLYEVSILVTRLAMPRRDSRLTTTVHASAAARHQPHP